MEKIKFIAPPDQMGAQIVNASEQRSFTIEKQYTDLSSVFSLLTGLSTLLSNFQVRVFFLADVTYILNCVSDHSGSPAL